MNPWPTPISGIEMMTWKERTAVSNSTLSFEPAYSGQAIASN